MTRRKEILPCLICDRISDVMQPEDVVKKIFHPGMSKADAVKAFARLNRRAVVYAKKLDTIRMVEYLAADIERHDLKTLDGVWRLEQHVKSDWSCREIGFMRSFLHAGRFISDSGNWICNSSGISTATHQEDSNLLQLWSRLMYDVHTFLGAAAVLDLDGATVRPGIILTDEADDCSLWDLSINELIKLVLRERGKRTDLVAVVAEAARKGAKEGLKGLQNAVKKAYRLAANSDDPDPLAPKRRKSGAGRKKVFDIGDIQVRSVLALMEVRRENGKPLSSGLAYSDRIIRNPPRHVIHPYKTAKLLDSAVRQYCIKIGIRYDPPLIK